MIIFEYSLKSIIRKMYFKLIEVQARDNEFWPEEKFGKHNSRKKTCFILIPIR